MIIDCISDLHGFRPNLKGGDLLIVAGDLTNSGLEFQYDNFYYWLKDQDYSKKIVVAGNHDGLLQGIGKELVDQMFEGLSYLQDSGFDWHGLKIWGSPWTPTFQNWSFMKDRGEPIKKMWDLIPDDTNILITHGPPHGIFDKSALNNDFESVGCMDLANKVYTLKNLKLHVFGHIHEGYGIKVINHTTFVNCSLMDENYYTKNKPIRVIL